jgi:hypothetical protein
VAKRRPLSTNLANPGHVSPQSKIPLYQKIIILQPIESSHVKYNFRGIILSFKNLTEVDMIVRGSYNLAFIARGLGYEVGAANEIFRSDL